MHQCFLAWCNAGTHWIARGHHHAVLVLVNFSRDVLIWLDRVGEERCVRSSRILVKVATWDTSFGGTEAHDCATHRLPVTHELVCFFELSEHIALLIEDVMLLVPFVVSSVLFFLPKL